MGRTHSWPRSLSTPLQPRLLYSYIHFMGIHVQPSSKLYPSQVANTANLNCIQDPISHFIDSNLNYSYHPENYFYEEEKQVEETDSDSDSILISESDSDSGEETAIVHKKPRRDSRRSTARVSLIINDLSSSSNHESYSLLHQPPARQSVKPAVVLSPAREPPRPPMGDLLKEIRAANGVKPSRPVPPPFVSPPPPSSQPPSEPARSPPSVPQIGQSPPQSLPQSLPQPQPPSQPQSQSTTQSQTPRPSLHADLLAEIRASGVGMPPYPSRIGSRGENAVVAASTSAACACAQANELPFGNQRSGCEVAVAKAS